MKKLKIRKILFIIQIYLNLYFLHNFNKQNIVKIDIWPEIFM